LRSESEIDPAMKVGHVSLNVFDLERSVEFYRFLLGFRVIGRQNDGTVHLAVSGSNHYLLELHQVKAKEGEAEFDFRTGSPVIPKRAGLYHFAILLPNRTHLADVLSHLGAHRDYFYFEGMADHLVSESIYLRDPDFIGIEIYRDRPASEWTWDGPRIRMATEMLDASNLLQDASKEGWKEMPADSVVGHVHLHISDLEKARFYSHALGMNLTCEYPGALFFAADRYHHHVATNVWLGKDIAPAAPDRVGLNHVGLELSSQREFERIVSRLSRTNADLQEIREQGNRSILAYDSDGIATQLYSR
jgi:catechol 2,3-dioxygenase